MLGLHVTSNCVSNFLGTRPCGKVRNQERALVTLHNGLAGQDWDGEWLDCDALMERVYGQSRRHQKRLHYGGFMFNEV